jgi:hypothetical protein
MTVGQHVEAYSLDRYLDSLDEDLPERCDKVFEKIDEGLLMVYDLEEDIVQIQRGVKDETQKGEEIRVYGELALVEVDQGEETRVYGRNPKPEAKLELIGESVQRKTDIFRERMRNDSWRGFNGVRRDE